MQVRVLSGALLVELATWPARRWIAAVGAALGTILIVGIPTDLIDTPLFGRDVPVTAWTWPVPLVTAALTGMLVATYVARKDPPTPKDQSSLGVIGSFLAFFAVGCPVCNKLALLALGYTGALQWIAPAQPFLAALSIALLAWALRERILKESACPVHRTDRRSASE